MKGKGNFQFFFLPIIKKCTEHPHIMRLQKRVNLVCLLILPKNTFSSLCFGIINIAALMVPLFEYGLVQGADLAAHSRAQSALDGHSNWTATTIVSPLKMSLHLPHPDQFRSDNGHGLVWGCIVTADHGGRAEIRLAAWMISGEWVGFFKWDQNL